MSRSRTVARCFVLGCLLLAASAHAKPTWKVTTDEKLDVVRGVDYDFNVGKVAHQVSLLVVPNNGDLDRLVYTQRHKVSFGRGKYQMRSIAFILENGKHLFMSTHTKPTASLRRYTVCNQVFEATTFGPGLMRRLGRIIRELAKRPVQRTPAGMAKLTADPAFKRLQREVRGQVRRLRPLAKQAWQTFSFASCEKPSALLGVLKASGQLKGIDLDDADLDRHDEKRDLVNPIYMYDYAVQVAPRIKAKGKGRSHVFELDAMGQGGPFSSLTNVAKYRGVKTLRLSSTTQAYTVQTDAFFVEMKIPIISWFTTIAFTHYIATRGGRRVLVATLMTVPGANPLLTWPLDGP